VKEPSTTVDYDEDDPYEVIFTANATAALKLVGECADWSDDCRFWTLRDSHTSVLGMREYVLRDQGYQSNATIQSFENYDSQKGFKCGNIESLNVHEVEAFLNPAVAMPSTERDKLHNHQHKSTTKSIKDKHRSNITTTSTQFNLFVYPAQSNFNGRIYPISWVERFHSLPSYTTPGTTDNGSNDPGNKIYSSTLYKPNGKQWKVLIDASAYGFIDLSQYKPDFVVISFYKMFGFPSGLGALVLKRSAARCLCNKRYFGGGTVDAVDPFSPWKRLRSIDDKDTHVGSAASKFEDGTLPFLDIVAVGHGLDWLESKRGWDAIKSRCNELAEVARNRMMCLRHGNGAPLCEVYTELSHAKTGNAVVSRQTYYGPVVAFNLKASNGEPIGSSQVMKLAGIYDIHLRSGCFCNTGACSSYLGLTSTDIKDNLEVHRHVCGDEIDFVNGKRISALRISFGDMNHRGDLDRWIRFLEEQFLDNRLSCNDHFSLNSGLQSVTDRVDSMSLSIKLRTSQKRKAVLKGICVYPIKSCGALNVKAWPLSSTGLLYDRQFMIVDDAGNAIGQKRCKKILLVQPIDINLNEKSLTLGAPGMDRLVISLEQVEDCKSSLVTGGIAAYPFSVTARFCGNMYVNTFIWLRVFCLTLRKLYSVKTCEYSDPHVVQWFSTFLEIPCRLVMHNASQSRSSTHKTTIPSSIARKDSAIDTSPNSDTIDDTQHAVAFQNESQFLVVSERSYSNLLDCALESGLSIEGIDIHNFRANLIIGSFDPHNQTEEDISVLDPFEEEEWDGLDVQIGSQVFTVCFNDICNCNYGG
jgi:molybdenum cofactor sulfurtransferase